MARTRYEDMLADQLAFAGYDFEREYKFFAPMRQWRADFFLRAHDLIIEVEGLLYRGAGRHQRGIGAEADMEKYNTATLMGYRILRFSQRQIMGTATRGKNKIPLDKAIDVVDNLILGSRLVAKVNQGYAAEALARWPIKK